MVDAYWFYFHDDTGRGAVRGGRTPWQDAAALSAAVTTPPKQENAPNSHGRTSPKERTSLFPATLRERGSGGEALLLEKRPLPQFRPITLPLREGARGRGFSQRSRLPRITYITNHTAASWGGRLAVRRVGGASMPVQSSVAAQGARSREARGRETVRGSSERLKSAT